MSTPPARAAAMKGAPGRRRAKFVPLFSRFPSSGWKAEAVLQGQSGEMGLLFSLYECFTIPSMIQLFFSRRMPQLCDFNCQIRKEKYMFPDEPRQSAGGGPGLGKPCQDTVVDF